MKDAFDEKLQLVETIPDKTIDFPNEKKQSSESMEGNSYFNKIIAQVLLVSNL